MQKNTELGLVKKPPTVDDPFSRDNSSTYVNRPPVRIEVDTLNPPPPNLNIVIVAEINHQRMQTPPNCKIGDVISDSQTIDSLSENNSVNCTVIQTPNSRKKHTKKKHKLSIVVEELGENTLKF